MDFIKNKKWTSKKLHKIAVNDFEDVYRFHCSYPNYKETILREVDNMFIKDESERLKCNSFKILGASYSLFKYFQRISSKVYDYISLKRYLKNMEIEIITASDGNYGVAVAKLCKDLEIQCSVIFPKNTPSFYCNSAKRNNSKVILYDGNYDECVLAAKKFQNCDKYIVLLDVAVDKNDSRMSHDVSMGYSTMFYELRNEHFDYIFLPVGVGGLALSCLLFCEIFWHKTKVISVEPCGYNSLYLSVQANREMRAQGGETIANGLKCIKLSLIALPMLLTGIYGCCTVQDSEIKLAYKHLESNKIHTGFTGCSSYAAALQELNGSLLKNKRVLTVNTEWAQY